ncbi:uncharacterized protein [Cicer arietinum]|uniref:uncharacterized protein n=1 Tax=Cicer arietinum TaxID=3827 RepID=UPI003CC6B634
MAKVMNPILETGDRPQTAGELQNVHSSYRLNGKNYLKWSQLIRTILKGKGKVSHLTDKAPDKIDRKFKSWDEEDSMIMVWLWNSMVPEISDTCMFLKSAKEIWDAVEQTYSKAKDAAQIYDVKVKTVAAKQGNRSVTEYANQLKSLWMELDHYRVIQAKCSEDSTILKEYIEQDRIYDFLVGLNPEYDQVRIQILGKEKVPGLNEVVAIIRSEESRRGLMLETSTTESSAMIAEGGTIMVANQRKSRVPNMKKKNTRRSSVPTVTSRATQERSAGNYMENPQAENGGRKEALQKVEGKDTPFTHYWILDSGATDHMTPLPKYFSTYSPCPSNKKISTADGTLITAAGQGEDKNSGRTIGHAREWNGLYYMDDPNLPTKSRSLISESTMTNKEKAQLYHCRLGHPSFRVVKVFFPSLFKNLNVESLHCEVCPISNKMSHFLFFLVHTDVWGPAYVPNISGPTPTPAHELTARPAPEPAPNDGKFGKNLVYSRREKVILESGNVQESNPSSLHEVTPSNPINSNDYNEFVSANLEAQVDQNLDLPIALRKRTRTCTQQPLYPLSNFLSFEKFSPTHKTFLTNLNSTHTPSSVSEALSDRKWKQAMDVEMEALNKNRTWKLVTLPIGKKPVGCKWVYTIKYRADGTIERYKARLVAKGFTQTYGVDYLETFAPVAKMNTVRVILSLAANHDWDLQQFDVKNAFLHGDLEEEIYMELPSGYNGQVTAGTVCKLRKALYGLKQSPRAWFGRFTKVMTGAVSDNKCLATEFEIKALGRLKYFLGIEVAHSKKGIFISQQKYITDLLKETGKTACRPASTPVDPNIKLGSAEEDIVVDKEMSQRLVGRLIYLSHTRPDIAFVVSLVSQFMHQPKEAHLQVALRIVQYLKGTPGRGILFKRNKSVSLEAYTDADYAGSVVDRRSTTGYCTFLAGNLVTWNSKKQSVVARSSAEAEFRAMAHGICELLWLKIILEDLKISIAHNPVQHDRTKRIEVDRHFIKEKLDSGMICTLYVSTQNQLADILTKGLNCINFEGIISKLGMENTYSPA